MRLLFIHGAPASGKLTTAKALLDRVNGRLFDNHAAIDVARTVFDFGTPEFWKLVEAVRMAVLGAAAKRSVPLLVTTFVYVEPDDLVNLERYEATIRSHGGELLPVFLRCSPEEIVRRVGNADRVTRRKMASEASARDFIAKHKIGAVPRPNCLVLDSDKNTAAAKPNTSFVTLNSSSRPNRDVRTA